MVYLIHRLLPEHLRRTVRLRAGAPDMEWSLENLRRNGFHPTTAVDVGAYRGEWTSMAQRVFPDTRVLMIEAQHTRAFDLERIAMKSKGQVVFAPVLLGPEGRTAVTFHENETVSSVLPEHYVTGAKSVELPMRRLDDVLEEEQFRAPELLKLDVQGYELEVLKGAPRAIGSGVLEVVLMEVSLIDINAGAPTVLEVIRSMDEWGFRLYDLCSMIRRPLDGALWQVDAIFIQKDSMLVVSKAWQ